MEKILVINNDLDTMNLLKDLLEKKEYKVSYTSNGKQSLQLAKEFAPDLVLVDMLQRNVVSDLRKNPDTANVPIILMTGYNWYDKYDVNVDAVIEKPFFLEQLQQKIKTTLTRKQDAGHENAR